MASVEDIFNEKGIPSSIWATIMQVESGGNASAYVSNGREESVGLFQLNRMGGLGTGYSVTQLLDPSTNASIAATAMLPAYREGLSKGLSGLALLRYVAYNSGWPTSAGTPSLATDPVVKAYDVKLVAAYGGASGGSSGGSSSGGSSSGSVKANDSVSLKLFFTVLGGALVIMGLKVLTDVPIVIQGGE